jgi:hypothetical protein
MNTEPRDWLLRQTETGLRKAADLGHDVEWDPGRQPRWTCRRRGCGRAVVNCDANVYGSATTEACRGER